MKSFSGVQGAVFQKSPLVAEGTVNRHHAPISLL
jgi:hypothetical protein